MRAAYGGYSVEAVVTSVERLANRLSHAKAFLREEVLLAPILTFDATAITWTGCWWTWGRLKTTSGGSRPLGRF